MLLIMASDAVAMAESDGDRLMWKHGIRDPNDFGEQSFIRAAMFRDPSAMIGRRVLIMGSIHGIEKADTHRIIYYVMMDVPFAEPERRDQVALLSMADRRTDEFLMCIVEIRGSIQTKGLISGSIRSIPKVREVECLEKPLSIDDSIRQQLHP